MIQYPHSSIEYLPLQAIFKPTRQALWDSPVIPHQINFPPKPFSNQRTKRCETLQSFLVILPTPPSHFRTKMTSTVSQSRHYSRYHQPLQAIFEPKHQALWSIPTIPQQITCPSKPFLNRPAKLCEPVQLFFIRLPAPSRHFQTDTPSLWSSPVILNQIHYS